ncbi:hypothetical protein FB45DRAFT_1065388 [Roridomyces roridus]|uniref:Uncharacterized protein n=1 Tax=Roridomyces roridus TaxID=1738132 RepID=A0AAD7FCT1_9AGAR|nr:hypothetical protein FB45DRAFT_1065388 [Roridomyces roridus]
MACGYLPSLALNWNCDATTPSLTAAKKKFCLVLANISMAYRPLRAIQLLSPAMATSPSSSSPGSSPNYIVEFVDLVSAALDAPALEGMLSLTGSGAAPSPSQAQVSSRVRQMFAKFKNFVIKKSAGASTTRLVIGRRVAAEYPAAHHMWPPTRRAFLPHIILIERVSVVSSPAIPMHDDDSEVPADQSRVLHRTKSLPSIPHEPEAPSSPLSTPSASSCSSGSSVESPVPATPLTTITEKVGGETWSMYSDFGPLTTSDPFAKSAGSILPPKSTAFRRPYLHSSSSNPNFHARPDDDEVTSTASLRRHPSRSTSGRLPPPAYPIPPTPPPRTKAALVGGEARGPLRHNHLPFPASSSSSPTALPRTRAKRSRSVSQAQTRTRTPRSRTGLAPPPPATNANTNNTIDHDDDNPGESGTPPVPSLPRLTKFSLPSSKAEPRRARRPSSPFPFMADRASAIEGEILLVQACAPISMSAPASTGVLQLRLGPNEGGRGSPFPL